MLIPQLGVPVGRNLPRSLWTALPAVQTVGIPLTPNKQTKHLKMNANKGFAKMRKMEIYVNISQYIQHGISSVPVAFPYIRLPGTGDRTCLRCYQQNVCTIAFQRIIENRSQCKCFSTHTFT